MDAKIEAFRAQIDNELKTLRLNIGNVGCLTTEVQRGNIVADIKRLEHRLKGERSRHLIRAGRNNDRASKRITLESKEKYNDRSSFYHSLVAVINIYLIKVRYLATSARNQFEKYKIDDTAPEVLLVDASTGEVVETTPMTLIH